MNAHRKTMTMNPRKHARIRSAAALPAAALLAVVGTAALSTTAQAATILINATTNNGSFELDAAGQPLTAPAKNDSQFWINGTTSSVLGTVGTFDQINASDGAAVVSDGSFSAAIGTSSGGTRNGIIGNTGHVVQSGETFNFSFDWFGANNNWSTTDEIEYFLFTTSDNTVSGTPTTILSGTASGVDPENNIPSAKQTVSLTDAGTVTAANVGQNLWVVFNHDASDSSFARVDNVQLSVVPEPASVALMGLGGLLMLGRGRASRR